VLRIVISQNFLVKDISVLSSSLPITPFGYAALNGEIISKEKLVADVPRYI